MPRVIDLFCGAGGFSCGLRAAGFHVVGGVDNDEDSLKTFHTNFPSAPIYNIDLTSPTAALRLQLRQLQPDVVVGGPPCQGFSFRNKHKYEQPRFGTVRDLSVAFVKLAVSLTPRVVMMEQVTTFQSTPQFQRALDIYKAHGYSVTVCSINMLDFGVPQHRRRSVLLAHRGEVLPSLSPQKKVMSVRQALSRSPRPPRGQELSPRILAKLRVYDRRAQPFPYSYTVMDLNAPARTITSNYKSASGGAYTIKRGDRYYHLSDGEAARIQGFPPTFVFTGRGTSSIARQIANAVPPPAAYALGVHVLQTVFPR